MAHRGWPARYPENSLAGVRAALEAGARMVEFDIQITADGVPVVLHDESLQRTGGRGVSIHDVHASVASAFDVSEVARLGGADGDHVLPTLGAMLALFDQHPEAIAFIELKSESMARFGRDAVVESVLEQVGHERRHVLIAADGGMLERIRAARVMHIGWVTASLDEEHEKAARALAPEFVFCSARVAQDAEAALWDGPWRWVIYDVNDARQALELLGGGADIIETDRIGELLSATAP